MKKMSFNAVQRLMCLCYWIESRWCEKKSNFVKISNHISQKINSPSVFALRGTGAQVVKHFLYATQVILYRKYAHWINAWRMQNANSTRIVAFLSVAHNIPLSLLWKHPVCVRSFLGTSGRTAFLYMKGLFVIPKSKNRRQLKEEIDRMAWNMQVVCQQTRSTCIPFIDWPFAQILNAFFVGQWTQRAVFAYKSLTQKNRSNFCKLHATRQRNIPCQMHKKILWFKYSFVWT
jgi:hypothetical protein